MPRPTLPGRRPKAPNDGRGPERGQMLVIFALAMVALVGMVGLIIDGGDTALQRRDQQNVADAAAMAAGFAYVNGMNERDAAAAVAASNGYVDGANGTTVTIHVNSNSITVEVTRPHQNYFSGVLGFSSWDVSAEATVIAGWPNGAYGSMPLIFNQDAFNNPDNRNSTSPTGFSEPGSGTEDVPQGDSQFNWTVFCTANGDGNTIQGDGNGGCNGDSNTVEALINDEGTSTVVYLDDDIGPLNAGAHTTLFDSLADHVGEAYPVAIVSDAGELIGWAYFHITGSVGGSTKEISGWFDGSFNAPPMTIIQGHGNASTDLPPVVHLID